MLLVKQHWKELSWTMTASMKLMFQTMDWEPDSDETEEEGSETAVESGDNTAVLAEHASCEFWCQYFLWCRKHLFVSVKISLFVYTYYQIF